jgi:L-amino acid N-acyltransferase YncA
VTNIETKTSFASAVAIHAAREEDFAFITEIYAPYVLNTTVSLEETPPSVEEMLARWRHSTEKGLPYLIARIDGKIAGYCYATTYRPRTAYRFTVEESVYIAEGYTGMGIGKMLLNALIAACSEKGFKQMIAVIGDADNTASVKLHKALGFVHVGTLKAVGFKHGKWTNSALMQRELP